MDNQHRKIDGYRELSQEEIDLINQVKAHGAATAELLEAIEVLPGADLRAVAVAKTNLQTGVMWLVRSIAKPQGF